MSERRTPSTLVQAAASDAPTAKDAASVGGVIVLSVTDTVALFMIPTWLKGRRAMFTMDGTDADVLFGDSAVVADYGHAASVDGATRAITVNAGSGGHLKDGIAKQWRIPRTGAVTHFSVDCKGSGSGKLYIEPL